MVLSSISAAESGITPFNFLYLLNIRNFSILKTKVINYIEKLIDVRFFLAFSLSRQAGLVGV